MGLFTVKSLHIGDFGVSTQLQNEGDMSTTITGSKFYMAPEILLKSYDPYAADSKII